MADAKKASLTVLGGPLAGARCVLPDSGVVSVGSAEGSTLRLDLPGVSPFHARIVVEHGGVTVFETGASRRVHINDNPVAAGGTALRNGDILWLGTPGEDDVVMLQCVLPRRVVEVSPSDSSPDVTLAAVPLSVMPVAEPTPQIETTALDIERGRLVQPAPADENDTIMFQGAVDAVSPAGADDELVFAEEAQAAVVVDEAASVVPEPEFVAEESPEPTAHVVVPDFERAVFVEPTLIESASETVAGETVVTPNYEPIFEPPSEVEPTVFVAADQVAFEETIEDSVQEAAAIAAQPAPAPEPPRPAPAPPPIPHPERSSPALPRPQARRDARAGAPPHASQAGRRPDATHGPGRHAAAPVRKKGGGGGTLVLVGGVAAVLLVAALGWFGWRYLAPRFAKPSPETTPVTEAQATPLPPELTLPAATPAPAAVPTPETTPASPEPTPAVLPSASPAATPTPRGSPSPTPRATPTPSARPTTAPPPTTVAPAADTGRAQQAVQVASLLQEAQAALSSRQYDAAIGHADGILRLEPGHAEATTLRADASRRRDLSRRRFVAGRTDVQTAKKSGGLTGFESGDADLRRAPDFQGRIEFEMSPATGIEGGTAWTLRVYVVNDGKKEIRVQGVSVAGAPAPVRAQNIAPQQRAQVTETTGTWREGTTSWSTDVAITANKGDSLRNTLTWR